MYDIIIVGGGPAGMTAALYARRNGKTALVIEKNGFGGQITHSPKVENFPGTITISGTELADSMMSQILEQGADIEIETVTSVETAGDKKTVKTEEGGVYESYAVIIATGVKHRLLGLEGEAELIGEGISFCAVCDGDFYTGKTVLMAGGGNSALQEAILLSDKCEKVIMLQDLPYFTGEESLQKLLFSRSNVSSLTGVKITKLLTEGGEFRGVQIEKDGETQEIYADGLFVAIGLIPENKPFENLAELNDYGYFDSDENCTTKTPGVFVAGDCRSKYIRQVTTAAADGTIAALAACRYINEIRR
ncbi:MAG: FAD-dependent oxidoreductase [Clostridia bacterium]|nr:FAD-dependent oxidoreductase [Clostridia bacterium]